MVILVQKLIKQFERDAEIKFLKSIESYSSKTKQEVLKVRKK
jgi:hypothetical protein